MNGDLFTSEYFYPALAIIVIVLLVLWLWVYVPARMARRRGRSAVGWVLLFWVITPFWGMVALWVLGDSKKKIRADIMEELHHKS